MPAHHPPIRVLVTRAAHQASALGDALAARGLLVVSIPMLDIQAPDDGYASLHRAMHALEDFDWLVFTSANAVTVFADQREDLEIEEVPCRIASIGAATGRALADADLPVHLQPATAVAESLAAALRPKVRGKRVLLVCAQQTRGVLERELEAAGAEFAVAHAYRNAVPEGAADALTRELPALSAITFASGSAVQHLLAVCDAASLTLPPHIVLASIGPVTSAALRASGYQPHMEATQPSIEVLASELARYLQRR